MINTFTFITSDFSLLSDTENYAKDNLFISFKIATTCCDLPPLTALHASPLLAGENVLFSIYIDFNDLEKDTVIEPIISQKNLLIQYFFHPNYKKVNQKPIVCFSEKARRNSKIKELISFLDLTLINQGYKGLEPVYFNEDKADNDFSNICFPETQSAAQQADAYSELLKTRFYSSKYIGIKSNKIDETLLFLKAVESKLLTENPIQYHHLEKFCELEKSNRTLNEELEYLKFDLQNQKIYLEFFKNQDETLKINEFYHNEYEILPLWYKKFGHLIKVITGKRTFRSLFDNNIKKYKG